MIGFTAVAAAVLCVGMAAAAFLWRRLDGVEEREPLELVTAGAVIGLALWLAASWALAYAHWWTRGAVLAVAALFVQSGAAGSQPARWFDGLRAGRSRFFLLLPLLLWIVYVLGRGVVLPPANHDALAYHLPKAALLMDAHGIDDFTVVDSRITLLPWNYELLLSAILITEQRDTVTEWVGTLFYILLLVATGAIARRWWGRGLHVTLCVLVVGATPVLLLNSGAEKADLMAVFLAIAAIVFAARWTVEGGRTNLGLTTLALAVGAGTKSSVAAVGVAIAPFLLYRFIRELRARRVRLRDFALATLVAIAAFLLCGCLEYVDDFFKPVGLIQAQTTGEQTAILRYGDWQNLWQVPYLILTVPFSSSDEGVWVPWRDEHWFWPHYELFFSHYGELFTLLVLALPFAVFFYRRQGDDATRRQRAIATVMALLAIAISLPVAVRPVGMFAAFPRYFAFIVPLVVCWTVGPVVRQLEEKESLARVKGLVAVAVAACFVVNAMFCAVQDRFTPLEYAQIALEYPGTRMVWFSQRRAVNHADRIAGPNDTIAIDGTFDTWSYPAWGAKLTRKVIFLKSGTTADQIPANVQWVVLDHSWDSLWGATTNMGEFWTKAAQGPRSPVYTRLTRALLQDPHWRATYLDPSIGQAVFRRVR
ncbi:MAG TPA: hypothetical protein VEK79_08425 [Thermoanaerobaculia bacterium]|nr:hypothetical protein [Thermoanaerobaculia bacterium]